MRSSGWTAGPAATTGTGAFRYLAPARPMLSNGGRPGGIHRRAVPPGGPVVITFKHVLCPIDMSEPSLRPLAYAAGFARWYNARLTVLHVVPTFDPIPVHPGALEAPVRIVYPMSREDVVGALQRTVEGAGVEVPDMDIAAEAGGGVPAAIVDQAVARAADLLVLGTHGRSGFDRLLPGSGTQEGPPKGPG